MKKNNKLHYAGFWRRLSASLVDILITMPILISLMYLLGLNKYFVVEIDENLYSLVENKQAATNKIIIDIISLFIVSFYYILFVTSEKKATIGKMIFGIYVVDIHGNKLTKKRALARFLLATILTIATLGIGLITVAFTKEKTTIYDLICGTRVIKKTSNEGDEDE